MKNLQEETDYKVMNVKECLNALGWSYDEEEGSYANIKCSCGSEIECSGFFGTERCECNKCGKYMVDLFSPIRVSNSTCAILEYSDYEVKENRHWIAIDRAGGIKL